MSPHPMSGPDPSRPLPSATGVLRAQSDDPNFETDFAGLAARFSAKSGGGLSPELSADLALEIVLNEIVEQACLATGATGAAVVLSRDGEMVCRASSGTTAPELGARLDTDSGLSGECVKTRRTQRCDDVLTDPRADAAASLRLGVRSVMVMPLVQGTELVGVIELFSPLAYAFGDRDEGTLEVLAGRVLSNLERAAQVREPQSETPPPVAEPIAESIADPVPADAVQQIAPDVPEPVRIRRLDVVTWALGAVVLLCAVSLSVLVVRHLGVRTAVRAHAALPASTTAAAQAQSKNANATSKAASTSTPVPAVKPRSEVPPGGLRVYENGKQVFSLPPTENHDADAGMQRASSVEPEQVVEISPSAAEGILLHRVEPEYPAEASQKGVQGAVVLEVHISADGAVQDVQVVSGPPELAAASTAAVRQWRFKPRAVDGHPVEMQTTVTLNFRLPQ